MKICIRVKTFFITQANCETFVYSKNCFPPWNKCTAWRTFQTFTTPTNSRKVVKSLLLFFTSQRGFTFIQQSVVRNHSKNQEVILCFYFRLSHSLTSSFGENQNQQRGLKIIFSSKWFVQASPKLFLLHCVRRQHCVAWNVCWYRWRWRRERVKRESNIRIRSSFREVDTFGVSRLNDRLRQSKETLCWLQETEKLYSALTYDESDCFVYTLCLSFSKENSRKTTDGYQVVGHYTLCARRSINFLNVLFYSKVSRTYRDVYRERSVT